MNRIDQIFRIFPADFPATPTGSRTVVAIAIMGTALAATDRAVMAGSCDPVTSIASVSSSSDPCQQNFPADYVVSMSGEGRFFTRHAVRK